MSTSTESSETLKCIQSWLYDCDRRHKDCIRRRQSRQFYLPYRLLYVGADQRVELRESKKILPYRPEYLTLSHCWGKTGGLKLTEGKYAEFLDGIELETLPRTFRDAVDLTRRIGKDYLWIDSMCTIQDSVLDWREESPRMSEIYAGAFLNIAAMSSWNSHGGIYQRRSPLSFMPCQIKMDWSALNWHQKIVGLWPKGYRDDIVGNAPLTTRAWAVQERLLAPRTVHFLAHKVVWECASFHASESDCQGALESRRPFTNDGLRWAIPPPQDQPLFQTACLEKWYEALSMYTHGDLTFQTDKLIAISGLARILKSMWRGGSVKYWVGMWSYQLEWSLCWYTYSPGQRPAHPLAPSWSWASIRGRVYTPQLPSRLRYLSRVLRVEPESTNDLFEAIGGSILRILGPLCPVTASPDTNGTEPQLQFGGRRLNMDLKLDEGILPIQEHTSEDQLFLLGIAVDLEQTLSPMIGLVVRKTGNKIGEYVRMGQWTIYNDYPEDNGYGRVGEAFVKSLKSKHTDRGVCTITLA